MYKILGLETNTVYFCPLFKTAKIPLRNSKTPNPEGDKKKTTFSARLAQLDKLKAHITNNN